MSSPHTAPRLLLCLDFDLTLSKTHLFRYVVDAINGGFSREQALLRAIQVMNQQGPKGGELLWGQLAQFLKQGHGLVVTSYTAFPELPIALLAQGIRPFRALDAKGYTRWLSRPIIIYGNPAPRFNPPQDLPNTFLVPASSLDKRMEQKQATQKQNSSDHSSLGKNLHIQEALRRLEEKGQRFDQVILMDDDEYNLSQAQAMGVHIISVCKEAQSEQEEQAHLHELEKLVKELSV